MANGLGAWGQYYRLKDGFVTMPVNVDERMRMTGAAVLSLKAEAKHLGFDIIHDTHYFGGRLYGAVRDYQASQGLVADGVVGPKTAKAIYLPRVRAVTDRNNIPDDLVAKLIQQESAFDPGAQGFSTPSDYGLAQINFDFHAQVTRDDAADGKYAINFVAHSLVLTFAWSVDWDVALAAYNVGSVNAVHWQREGKPENNLDGTPSAAFAYVKRVRAQVI